MQTEDIATVVKKAFEEAIRERGNLNVLIAGRTGVGKSTLINSFFGGKMAETGQGRPVTQSTREISKDGIPIKIWDTRGLELAAFKETIDELEQLVSERSKDKDPNKHIHLAWLCIQEGGRRVEDAEIELHQMLAKHMPVIGVITKSLSDEGFRAEVQKLLPMTKNVVRVRAIPQKIEGYPTIEPFGLEELLEATDEVAPEGQRRALAAAQKVSIRHKKKRAHGVVVTAATAAGAAGASPIPFSDVFILVPIQVAMLAGISATFGLELSKAFLSTLVASAAGGAGASFAGRAIVSNILKFIPGVGTVAGGAISGATAAALTTALGEAYIATLVSLFVENDNEIPDPNMIAEAFKIKMTAK